MADNYLEMAATELRIAKMMLDRATDMSPSDERKYEERLRLADRYTKLAAIQAGLPPAGQQPISGNGASE